MAHNKRFASYRNAILRAFAVLTFLATLSIATLPEVSRAQCPDNTWTQSSTPMVVLIPGTTCLVDVWYCWKVIGGTMTFWIDFVEPEVMDNCNTLTPKQIIIDAITGFESNPPNPVQIQIKPCGQGTTTVFEYQVSDCWAEFVVTDPVPGGPPVGVSFGACLNGTSMCMTDCEYCQEPGGPIDEVSCTSTSIWNGDCTGDPPTDYHDWQLEHCYNLNPCNNE